MIQEGIDDALATPHVIADQEANEVVAAIAVTMFPPPILPARKLFKAMTKRSQFEAVTNPFMRWRPLREGPVASITIARSGRIIITAGQEVIFDDSTAGFAPDELDRVWQMCALEHGRVLIFIGGPQHLTSAQALEDVADAHCLIGGWGSIEIL